MKEYYVIDENGNSINVSTNKIKWASMKPYYFGGQRRCPSNPIKCSRSYVHKANKRMGCRDSKTCHFCKHPVFGFVSEGWGNIFLNKDKVVISKKEEMENLFNKDDINALKQYENIGLGVIKQKHIIYKQFDGGRPTLCFWGKNDKNKNYEDIFVVTSINIDSIDSIKTVFRSSGKYAKILNILKNTPQYRRAKLSNSSDKDIAVLVSPYNLDSFKPIHYYEDEINNRLSSKLCQYFNYDRDSKSNFKLMIHLQQELENSLFKYKSGNSYKTLENVICSYLLYKNYRFTIDTLESKDVLPKEWLFEEKIKSGGYYFNMLKKRHVRILNEIRDALFYIQNSSDVHDNLISIINDKIQKLKQVNVNEFNFNINESNSDDNDYFYELFCINLLLNFKLYNYFIESDYNNSIYRDSKLLDKFEQLTSQSELFRFWYDLVKSLWV